MQVGSLIRLLDFATVFPFDLKWKMEGVDNDGTALYASEGKKRRAPGASSPTEYHINSGCDSWKA